VGRKADRPAKLGNILRRRLLVHVRVGAAEQGRRCPRRPHYPSSPRHLGVDVRRDIGIQNFFGKTFDEGLITRLVHLVASELPRDPAAHVSGVGHSVQAMDTFEQTYRVARPLPRIPRERERARASERESERERERARERERERARESESERERAREL
jgi:hypothetical protein